MLPVVFCGIYALGVNETLVLRTYPASGSRFDREFLDARFGEIAECARRTRRPKSAFGAGLERLSRVRMAYFQRENPELASFTGCELIESQFAFYAHVKMGVKCLIRGS
jgi:recombinational DNA repair protein (RecF pathway)